MTSGKLINCNKCGAVIEFVKNRNDNFVPINPRLIKLINFQGDTVEGYLPHWATCTDPEKFKEKIL